MAAGRGELRLALPPGVPWTLQGQGPTVPESLWETASPGAGGKPTSARVVRESQTTGPLAVPGEALQVARARPDLDGAAPRPRAWGLHTGLSGRGSRAGKEQGKQPPAPRPSSRGLWMPTPMLATDKAPVACDGFHFVPRPGGRPSPQSRFGLRNVMNTSGRAPSCQGHGDLVVASQTGLGHPGEPTVRRALATDTAVLCRCL